MIGRMRRYFFLLAYPDQEIGDPRGVIVPSDDAAIEAGRKIIDELLAERGPEDPRPTIIVACKATEFASYLPKAFRSICIRAVLEPAMWRRLPSLTSVCKFSNLTADRPSS